MAFSIANALANRALLPPLRRIDVFRRDPAGTQEQVLRRLLHTAADTEWGRRHDFAALVRRRDLAQVYRDRVPLADYASLQPFIERMYRGDADVLWPGRVTRFAVSGGTVDKQKLLPVTAPLLRANARLVVAAVSSYLHETGDWNALRGTRVSLSGYVRGDPAQPGVVRGEVSGLTAQDSARRRGPLAWIRQRRAVPAEILEIENWEQKLDAIAGFAMNRDVRLLGMSPPWGLDLFRRVIQRHNEAHGTSVETVGAIWPNLSVIVTGGMPLRTYRPALRQVVGRDSVRFIELYGASEAPIAFSASEHDEGLSLDGNGGVYFEFVRYDEIRDAAPRRHGVGEIEAGVLYVPVLTTCGGLWAYVLGDIVRFTETRPPTLTVVGRLSEVLDSLGEHVTGDDLRAALQAAVEATGEVVVECHVAPLPGAGTAPNRHQWLIEFASPPVDVERFTGLLDRTLQGRSASYRDWRTLWHFGPPHLVAVPHGTFGRWLRASRADASVQSKVPLVASSRDVADALLAISDDFHRAQGRAEVARHSPR